MNLLTDTTSARTAGSRLVLVPVGSVEQHGPHLPLGTDTVVAETVARAVSQQMDAWLAPSISYGASGEHQSFTGTSSIGSEALRHVVVELVRSMRTWCERVVLINGHGGNAAALSSAVEQLRDEGHDVSWVPCRIAGADAHAGRTETSLMMHLAPWSVRSAAAAPGDTRSLAEILPSLRVAGVAAVSPNGVLGDPTGASAGEGKELLARMVQCVLRDVRALAS